jgi:Protein of unknown function (DUF2752)
MTVRVERRDRNIAVMAAVGASLAALGGLVALFHLDHLSFSFCAFKTATGFPCLTCGTTRALGRLIHLDVRGALTVNPLATVVLLALFMLGLVDAALMARGRSLTLQASPLERRGLIILLALAAIVNWAYLIAAGV